MSLYKKLFQQKGAMFGLDARIALAIMGAISVIAGSYYFASNFTARARAMSEELRQYGLAIDGYQYDLKEDLSGTVTTANGTNEVTALFDDSVIQASFRGLWNGPYLDHQDAGSLLNAPGAVMTFVKSPTDSTAASCSVITSCNYWIRLQPFSENTAIELDRIFDGGTEGTPEDEGILRWNNHSDANMVDLWFAASQAFSM